MNYVDVAVGIPVDHLYTYHVPPELAQDVAVGKRALIPFRNKYMTGYIVQIASSTEVDPVKDLLDLLDPDPVVPPPVLALTKWIADYYGCPWGLAIKAALPAGIETLPSMMIRLNTSDSRTAPESDLFHHDTMSVSGDVQHNILRALRKRSPLSLQELQRKVGKKRLHNALYALEKQGILTLEQVTTAGKARPKTLQHIILAHAPDTHVIDIPALAQRAPKQALLLQKLQELFPQEVPIVHLQELLSFDPRSTVRSLVQKGYVRVYPKAVRRNPLGHVVYQKTSALALTEQQQAVLDHLKAAIEAQAFAPILLHGITGSGKTEIYLQAIAHLLTLHQRAIILVPEISLTPLLVSRFLSRFGQNIAVLHSGLSLGERYDEWQRIRRGEVDVVIGARSAIFAPVEHLGLIIVDEEHEASYKQDTDPRYHGRDTAVMRARLENIPVLLASATPSLESYYNAQTERYTLLTLTERIDRRPLPVVEIVDKRQEHGHHLFSNLLEEAMREVLARGEQVLLFLNLRGFANFYLCRECGFVYECPRCNVTLTYHASSRRLQCHYCEFSRLPPTRCAQCGSSEVQYRGIGTERIEQEVQLLFPEARVARMDRDTVSGKHAHYHLLRRFDQGTIDILIGTQMVTKGHDFPNVTLVGVIAAEIGLHLPDFRASERTFQLLTQVAGRTGRGHLPGRVIIQTYT
ncbi:primosomal protein N', partial [candidate division KSB3 bacterium]|nr:primosomal protein N' [candidate division KSB3 bacterium]MBD3324264.1 primosomal protein N' [candidate division KSB3 bacterium]